MGGDGSQPGQDRTLLVHNKQRKQAVACGGVGGLSSVAVTTNRGPSSSRLLSAGWRLADGVHIPRLSCGTLKFGIAYRGIHILHSKIVLVCIYACSNAHVFLFMILLIAGTRRFGLKSRCTSYFATYFLLSEPPSNVAAVLTRKLTISACCDLN